MRDRQRYDSIAAMASSHPVNHWLLLILLLAGMVSVFLMILWRAGGGDPRRRDVTSPPSERPKPAPRQWADTLVSRVLPSNAVDPQDRRTLASRRTYRVATAVLIIVGALPIVILYDRIGLGSPGMYWAFLVVVGLFVAIGRTIVRGLLDGQIELISRGPTLTFSRCDQPFGYWLTVVWNSCLLISWPALIAVALHNIDGQTPNTPIAEPRDSCFVPMENAIQECSAGERQLELAALSRTLSIHPGDAIALERRARLYESADDIDRARLDWDRLRVIRNRKGRPLTGT